MPVGGAGGRARAFRVAIVHDYLTQRGGAERVVLALMAAFPGARLITSVYNPETTFPEFDQYNVETTWLNRWPLFRSDPRRAMPLLPAVFSGVKLDDVDVVICSSSGWAHGIRTRAPKLVYCHTPARWLYQRHQYVDQYGELVRFAIKAMSPYLKWWDRRAAATAATYLANSEVVAQRIRREYDRDSTVLPPPITIDRHADREAVEGLEPGFLLTVSRARSYKNVEVVCEAVSSLPGERLVVVGGLPGAPADSGWPDRLLGVSDVSDAQLRWLYANSAAVVAASHEDFGLTPLEGNTFGKPAVVLRAGGFLDTLVEGHTGVFIEDLTAEAVREALRELRSLGLDNSAIVAHAETFGFQAFKARLVEAAHRAVTGHVRPAAEPAAAISPVLTRQFGMAATMAALLGALLAAAKADDARTVRRANLGTCLAVGTAAVAFISASQQPKTSTHSVGDLPVETSLRDGQEESAA